ncbi:PREDICTED: uncharacterized protein LOC105965866 [Erythranthe guttata]|uniref:uncharacterized protein LOC105965866 n=1 Tax=Erythranthe guttata TaxID=4155 RepID=UPI00064E0834|nr:PREDICTED: uncharacterized protein LOC105965866 [Erythranthe guttata]|eukprot:XP_012845866.1 PREDICTED: uncharacterized protein LOC105965866 [Erythranthe guttata]
MDWNRSAGTSNRSSPKDEFTDLVLSWSLQDIFNDNLYKDQVEKIPKSFESVDKYLCSYIFPLLEETRAELRSATETVCNAPSAKVASFTERTHGKFMFNVKVDQWRNVASGFGSERHRILPGDVVLLSDSNSETISRSQLIGGTYIFACINNIKNDDSFVLKTAEQIGFQSSRFVRLYIEPCYAANSNTHKSLYLENNWLEPLALIRVNNGVEMCEVCPFKYNVEMEEKLRSSLSSKLNESQLDAISACLSKSECSHRSSVELIWGPPGTGKTSTLSNLLHLLLKKNVRTLVCAPTNVAVKELASRVVALVRNSVLTESRDNLLPCPLGDMFIFGNNDRFKVGADIEEIYLDYRVKKLWANQITFGVCQRSISTFSNTTERLHVDANHSFTNKISEKAGYGRSMFERLSLLGHPKHLLNVQYRMHPSISWFPNSKFYRNRILDAPIVQRRSYERCYLQGRIYGPYSFINIPGSNEEFDDFGRSRRNMVEVAVAVTLVHKLFKGMLRMFIGNLIKFLSCHEFEAK